MTVYSHNYVTIADVCRHNDLDYNEVMNAICNSHISFGNNEDTLVSRRQLQDTVDSYLEETVDLDWGKLDDSVLISLGS
jgi:hypothetical protein